MGGRFAPPLAICQTTGPILDPKTGFDSSRLDLAEYHGRFHWRGDGGHVPPGSEFRGMSPQKWRFLKKVFLIFTEKLGFSGISEMKVAKSEDTSEFGVGGSDSPESVLTPSRNPSPSRNFVATPLPNILQNVM